MSITQQKSGLVRADHELFLALYKYRALSTSQVRKIMDYGDKYVYKKLNKLRKEGYIISQHIRGNYILGQSRLSTTDYRKKV